VDLLPDPPSFLVLIQGEATQKNVFTTQKATEELILATQKEEIAS
jgi:hypothetical protein